MLFIVLILALQKISFAASMGDTLAPKSILENEKYAIVLETRTVELNGHPLKVVWLELDPSQAVIELSIQEELNKRSRMDHSIGQWTVDNIPVLQWEKVKMPIARHVERYQNSHPTHHVVAILPNGNLFANDWYIAYTNGTVYHRMDEPVENRIYSTFIVYRDGTVGAADVRFVLERQHWRVLRLGTNKPEDITNQILHAFYGQHIVKNGVAVPLLLLSDHFSNLRHLLLLPGFKDPRGFEHVLGTKELARDEQKRRTAMEGRPVHIEGMALREIQIDTVQRDRVFEEWGYSKVVSEDEVKNPGDYFVHPDGSITIQFKVGINPLSIIAITRAGRMVSVSIPGKTNKEGITVRDAAFWLSQNGIQDAFLLAEGGDVFLQYEGVERVRSWSNRTTMTSVVVIAKNPLPKARTNPDNARAFSSVFSSSL